MRAAIWVSPGAARIGRRRPASPARSICFRRIDTFDEGGSFFAGLQGGYNYMLPNRIAPRRRDRRDRFRPGRRLPTGVNPFGVSIGGTSNVYLAGARRRELCRDGAGVRHGARAYRLCSGKLAVLCDRWIRLDLRSAVADASRHRRERIRRSCGGWAGPREPASKCRLRRTGRRGSNICSPITAVTPCRSSRRTAGEFGFFGA